MHGLVNRSIERFLSDTYGPEVWADVAFAANAPAEGFEALMIYDDALTDAVLDAAATRLAKPREALLEDLGIYLAGREPLRRLLRFGGVDYIEFLHSLDELPERAHLALPDLDMPDLTLLAGGPGRYQLMCRGTHSGVGAVFAGILRAMADDYGALALIEAGTGDGDPDQVSIELLENRFADGRRFVLAGPEVS